MSATNDLLIATHNTGKVREIARLLSNLPLNLKRLGEYPGVGEVEETGQTFAENATIKARGYSERAGIWTLADDSGLEVDALGGAPGVFSARYAGPQATDAERALHLLAELERADVVQRRARFVCVVALADPLSGDLKLFTGMCEGHIAHEPRGVGGFGYDPVFIPDGFDETFGELPSDVKDQVSHRARVLESVRVFFERHLHDSQRGIS